MAIHNWPPLSERYRRNDTICREIHGRGPISSKSGSFQPKNGGKVNIRGASQRLAAVSSRRKEMVACKCPGEIHRRAARRQAQQLKNDAAKVLLRLSQSTAGRIRKNSSISSSGGINSRPRRLKQQVKSGARGNRSCRRSKEWRI